VMLVRARRCADGVRSRSANRGAGSRKGLAQVASAKIAPARELNDRPLRGSLSSEPFATP
jgi:hypothetical protein